MKKNTKTAPVQGFHYYASSIWGWVVADSREEVIKRLAVTMGSSLIKRAKAAGYAGPAFGVCRVELPQTAHYTISNYMPALITKEDGINEQRRGAVVPTSEVEYLRMTTVSGKTAPAPELLG
jgi:hypothetical protein